MVSARSLSISLYTGSMKVMSIINWNMNEFVFMVVFMIIWDNIEFVFMVVFMTI